MTTVTSATSAATTTASTSSSSSSLKLGTTDFLKLLMTQLTNAEPAGSDRSKPRSSPANWRPVRRSSSDQHERHADDDVRTACRRC
ncbi:flagellar hook capping FlgD N-terminal domain-containing protein [Caulobacter segnis]